MTPESEKLRIALEALLELHGLVDEGDAYEMHARRITKDALHAIRREHYLAAPSPVTADLLGARRP